MLLLVSLRIYNLALFSFLFNSNRYITPAVAPFSPPVANYLSSPIDEFFSFNFTRRIIFILRLSGIAFSSPRLLLLKKLGSIRPSSDILVFMSSNYVPLVNSRKGSAIIFNSTTQTVSTKKHRQLEGKLTPTPSPRQSFSNHPSGRVIKTQSVPKWDSYVDIYIGDEETKRLAATLNLDKLGWTTNMKRLCGKFSHIYVVECDSRKTSPLLQAL